MGLDFTKLRQALLDPADGPYALEKMRDLLIKALSYWSRDANKVADLFLPWSGKITQRSRDDIAWLIQAIEQTPWLEEVSLLEFCKTYKLIT